MDRLMELPVMDVAELDFDEEICDEDYNRQTNEPEESDIVRDLNQRSEGPLE